MYPTVPNSFRRSRTSESSTNAVGSSQRLGPECEESRDESRRRTRIRMTGDHH